MGPAGLRLDSYRYWAIPDEYPYPLPGAWSRMAIARTLQQQQEDDLLKDGAASAAASGDSTASDPAGTAETVIIKVQQALAQAEKDAIAPTSGKPWGRVGSGGESDEEEEEDVLAAGAATTTGGGGGA